MSLLCISKVGWNFDSQTKKFKLIKNMQVDAKEHLFAVHASAKVYKLGYSLKTVCKNGKYWNLSQILKKRMVSVQCIDVTESIHSGPFKSSELWSIYCSGL